MKQNIPNQFFIEQLVVELVPRRLEASVACALAVVTEEALLSSSSPSAKIACELLQIPCPARSRLVEHHRPPARAILVGEIGDLVRFDFQNFLRTHHKSFAERAAKCPPLFLIARCQSRGNRKN